ncbi:MAG: hypothetical protein ACOYYS_08225 [Chloroflexota bacterium]
MTTYYPLTVGNCWTYTMKDGSNYTNAVTGVDGNIFTMKTSNLDRPQLVRKDGDAYWADNYEAGNFQLILKDGLKVGDSWEIKYKANTIDNILTMTVKEVGVTKQVNGHSYPNVAVVEGDLKMNVAGNLMPANYQVQHYYADGVGLVLTTTSYGDTIPLTACELK